MELVIKRFGELSAEELYEILSLRAETFIAQQKIVYNDLDGLDYRATHVFYLDTPQGEETQGEKTVAAYLRILDPGVVYPQPTIGRVCSRRKGCGIGGKLLRDTIAYLAENTGSSTLLVEAQVSAEAVYRREGFEQTVQTDGPIEHFGVKHHLMSLDLNKVRKTSGIDDMPEKIDESCVSIRPVHADELPLLQRISINAFVDTFLAFKTADDLADYVEDAYGADTLAQELVDPEAAFYFIEVNREVVGYLKLSVGYAQTEAQRADSLEVQRIYLLPSYQGRGLGSLLMSFALTQAKKLGKTRAWLGVWGHNEPAKALYAKFGFKKFGHHTFVIGSDHQTDELWERAI